MSWLVLVPPHWMKSKLKEYPVVKWACDERPIRCSRCWMARCDFGMVNAATQEQTSDPKGAA